MTLAQAVRSPAPSRARPLPTAPSRYTTLLALPGGGRAETAVAVAEAAATLDRLLVIKTFTRPASASGGALMDELELAGQLEHENVVQTLSMGFEGGRYFVVNEYLEGATLRDLLERSRLMREALPNAAVLRILVALVAAVEHGSRVAQSDGARALVNAPVHARDVFITYDGQVKLLGFKATALVAGPSALLPRGGADGIAVDALLSGWLSPELQGMLAGLARREQCAPEERLPSLRRALARWQKVVGNGHTELASCMSQLLPVTRAQQTTRILARFSELQRVRRQDGLDPDLPPASGYRTRAATTQRGFPLLTGAAE